MTTPTSATAVRRRLGEVLIEQGTLTEDELEMALAAQRETPRGHRRKRLGSIVVELGLATEREVAAALAGALGLPLVDLTTIALDPELARSLPRAVVDRHLILPLRRGEDGRIILACSDPTNVVALDDAKMHLQVSVVDLVVAPESQLRELVARTWSAEDTSEMATLIEGEDSYDDGFASPDIAAMDAPTVRLVNRILTDGVRARASDIHIEPQATAVRVRFRVDGLLRDVMTLPRNTAGGVTSRIKVMSNLDIAERRLPQDGRTRLQIDDEWHDARVSTLPNIFGEKVVVRLLAKASSVPPVTKIGMDDAQLESLLTTLTNPQGLILLTGPTGSGKTSTLYAAIQQIKTPDRNIVTLEDPVEMQMPGITQVQMHERSGLTFARGLRSVLRQDPDVILVGEVRDRDTADLALEAALTGHLVLTTLHTNSAPAAITRLVDMGVAPFLVASSLSLVVAQRLARRVCPSCAAPYRPSDRVAGLLNIEINDIDGAMPMRGQGCSDCAQTGYLGRLGIFEVLPVTASLRAVLMATPNESAVTAAARAAGVQTLRAAALAKAHAGLTTYEEVLRVTQVDPGAVGQQCLTCSGTLAEDMVVCPWCATPVDRGHCLSCDRRMERSWRVCPWCRTPAPHPPVEQASATSGTPRVLVVDDSEAVRQFVTAVLHGTAEVVAVGSASEGLDLAASGGFDALVVDQVLPDLSGIEVIRLLRSEARTAALPVLMFTGGSNDGDLEQAARNAGADDYLEKPVDPAELESRIIQLVQRSAVFAD